MSQNRSSLDHSSHQEFVDYYAEKDQRPASIENFHAILNKILRHLPAGAEKDRRLDVLDVGCNAGTQCAIWAQLGHRVHGLDINQPILEMAIQRAHSRGQEIDFQLGSADALPWADQSMDICIALQLLEHVADWRLCLNEFRRVLRPGGIMFLSTVNALCPRQDEFNLLGYSWYPNVLKRHFVQLALTTRPDLANFAKYPAVHWFTPYGLKRELRKSGFACFDRFDLLETNGRGTLAKLVVRSVRAIPPLRWLGFIFTTGTVILAVRASAGQS
jgi:2-polyprenyl-3-methyl-5-hydroxy-6-metoxy-1,4-benzoquinol methylase